MDAEQIKAEYPLHWLVWHNDYDELEQALDTNQHDIERLDPRGRTPLMLATRLCHLQSLKCLIAHKANANFECDGWSVVQEAVATGDRDILTAVLEVRDLQRYNQRTSHVPALLQKLKDTPDFYTEMRWEFTSWVPLTSYLCPSDTYRVYKQGLNVRIDTTLLGFDERNWQRGNRSYIFRGDTDSATLIEVDHDAQESSVEEMKTISDEVTAIPPSAESVTNRLNAPICVNNVDINKISFERNKSGIWGWRSEKNENVNGYDCKVFGASNVEFVTRTRTEHLNEQQLRAKNSRTPLQSFLGLATAADEEEGEASGRLTPAGREDLPPVNSGGKSPLTAEEYFSGADLKGRDIGRPNRMSTKVQKFKANLWLSEEFPIKLQEQVLPILDLMSTMASPHVAKLKEFITMQLPSGFPVKIEIPLFHILNACVTFGNVFGTDTPVQHVTTIREEDRLSCVIDDAVFEVPAHYRKASDHRRQFGPEDEDDLLQLAIQRSLVETGTEEDEVDIWEALRVQRPVTPMNNFVDEDVQLQRVLHASLGLPLNNTPPSHLSLGPRSPGDGEAFLTPGELDNDLAMALRMSEQEQHERQLEMEREEKLLQEILALSLQEK